MKNSYDEVIKNVEVTDEMKDRILNNIKHLDLEKTPKKVVSFPNYRKYVSIAACLVILLVGSVVIQKVINLSSEPPVQVAPDIINYDSVNQLSDAVGFTVKEIQDIPFDVESQKYTAYWGELAQIEYKGSNNTVLLRMALGDEDVSGYYEENINIKNHMINGTSITLKGNNEQYVLAVWQRDRYSYSVQFIEGISEQEMLNVIKDYLNKI